MTSPTPLPPILTSAQKSQFERDGYLVIPNFVLPGERTSLLSRARQLLEDFSLDGHPRTTFSTGEGDSSRGKEHVGDDYFLDSGDKIRFFFVRLRLSAPCGCRDHSI